MDHCSPFLISLLPPASERWKSNGTATSCGEDAADPPFVNPELREVLRDEPSPEQTRVWAGSRVGVRVGEVHCAHPQDRNHKHLHVTLYFKEVPLIPPSGFPGFFTARVKRRNSAMKTARSRKQIPLPGSGSASCWLSLINGKMRLFSFPPRKERQQAPVGPASPSPRRMQPYGCGRDHETGLTSRE